jgi:stearoyl-CoA desaturase (delta-9 desaturase)
MSSPGPAVALGATSNAPEPGITVEQGRLRGPQFFHAVAIAILPLVAVALAVPVAMRVGVSAVDLGLLVGMFVVTILGISVGYHRLFSHRSFEASPAVRVLLGACGSMAAQGSISYWVSNHRRHHQYTDRPGDIHSPYFEGPRKLGILEGFWHAHMGWTFAHQLTNPMVFARDLYQDRVIARVNQLYLSWVFLGLLIPFGLGGLLTRSWAGAWTGLLWGGLVRLFLTYHFVNAIDSVTHIFGTRPFDTRDESTNNVWMVLPTMGEGWHNNHHAFPGSAMFGLHWWQIDPGGLLIRGLENLGQVWNVQVPAPEAVAERARRNLSSPSNRPGGSASTGG